jgi:hypothetical protein
VDGEAITGVDERRNLLYGHHGRRPVVLQAEAM